MAIDENESEETHPNVWRMAVLLAFGSLMAGLDTSLVNLGLHAIGDSVGASLTRVQWIHSGYLLALAASLPISGWLSRRYGAGSLWIWALVAFTVTSMLCAASPNIEMLIVARVLQGLAGGLLIPAGMTILGQVAGKARMGRVIAISTVPAIVAPAFGPLLGALLISALSWQWLFLINVPIGALGTVLAVRLLPPGRREAAGSLDLVSLALVTLGLPLTVYCISTVGDGSFPWILLVLGVVALSAFGWRSLHGNGTLVDLRLLGNRRFAAASMEVFFAGAALFGGLIVMPLYFQIQLGVGIVDAGLLLMAFSLAAAVTFPPAGWLSDRFGGGLVAATGLAVTVAGTVPMVLLPETPNLVLLEFLQVARGVGLALAGSPGVSAALAAVRTHEIADASVQVNVFSRVGGALGSALLVSILMNDGVAETIPLHAFRAAFWWLAATATVALGAAVWLALEQRKEAMKSQPTQVRRSMI
ncbi:DHA2 family efflux MFS transporter permease subunit [Rhodococcus sovatensis]|uniref:DHA2 family efflux MFS transporter permease subunit n=1 Tax=Rhodococcus sovatensis TaxID=1805840 RepID=A0ABZ2PHX7_9NOCA